VLGWRNRRRAISAAATDDDDASTATTNGGGDGDGSSGVATANQSLRGQQPHRPVELAKAAHWAAVHLRLKPCRVTLAQLEV